MSARGAATTVMWTQLLAAIKKGYPELDISNQAGVETTKVIREFVSIIIPIDDTVGSDSANSE